MLLVDDHETEIPHRSEDRRSGPDDDPRLAAGNAIALVTPLGLPEGRVQDRDRVAESLRKRPTVCGASAISGTSTIVPRPRSSAASQALR